MLNVWKLAVDCRPQYYMRHPIKFIRDIKYGLRWSWQRITRGYAHADVFNLGFYLSELLPKMLRDLADTAVGYPDGFETYEEWIEYLRKMADHLENGQENQKVETNQWENLFFEYCCDDKGRTNKMLTMSKDELRDLYFKREKEISDWRHVETKKGLEMMSDVWERLWD